MTATEALRRITCSRRTHRSANMYEVFNPTDGVPVYRVKYMWLARMVACITGLDWAKQGEGW